MTRSTANFILSRQRCITHTPPPPLHPRDVVEETWKTEACSQGGYGCGWRFGYVRDRFYCSFVARFHSSYFTLYQGQALASNSNGIKYIPFGNDSAKFSLSRISSIRNLGRVAEEGDDLCSTSSRPARLSFVAGS